MGGSDMLPGAWKRGGDNWVPDEGDMPGPDPVKRLWGEPMWCWAESGGGAGPGGMGDDGARRGRFDS